MIKITRSPDTDEAGAILMAKVAAICDGHEAVNILSALGCVMGKTLILANKVIGASVEDAAEDAITYGGSIAGYVREHWDGARPEYAVDVDVTKGQH